MKIKENKNPLVLLAVVTVSLLAVAGTTTFSAPIASSGVGDGFGYEGLICVCKNGAETCNSNEGASCKHNTITHGQDCIMEYLGNTSAAARAAFDYLAVANGAEPVAGDTTLNNEITTGGLGRAQATKTENSAGNWSLVNTFTASASHTSVNTTGIFNQSADGCYLVGGTFGAVNLISGDTLTVNYTLAVS